MLKKSVIHIFLVSFLAVMLTGCRSSKATRVTAPAYAAASSDASGKGGKKMSDGSLGAPVEALLSEARSWLGVPYKYGGNDRGGVDCSGFVLQVYLNALDIPLPRSSREQHNYCKATTKGSLIPGDLIFFASDKDKERISHVGIFVGDNLMIHASTSRGVVISDLTSAYYVRNYAGSGIVERYHNMLGEKAPKKVKEKKKAKTDTTQEGPVIHISKNESPAGYSLTPVEGLPVQKEKPAKKSESKPIKTAVSTAVSSSATTAEPTVEDARASVLKSIKEKDL